MGLQRIANALPFEPDYVSALRGEVTAALGGIAGYCPWFEALWEKAHDDAVGVSREARARIIADARENVRQWLVQVLNAGPAGAAKKCVTSIRSSSGRIAS